MSARKKSAKKRADALLVERGLVDTRSKAQALILAGKVFSLEERVTKPGTLLPESAELHLSAMPRFVSRGGYKLEGALESLDVDVTGLVCVDVGASTGGFTDCLLQRGARRVYAVDVGQGLLAESLLRDERVVVRDKTNARHLTARDFDEVVDLIVVDASFIGIEKMTEAFARTLPSGGTLLAMIKPQFEVGKEAARRAKGVIVDPELRTRALESAKSAIERAGFTVLGGVDSVLAGPKGNVEYFVHARRV